MLKAEAESMAGQLKSVSPEGKRYMVVIYEESLQSNTPRKFVRIEAKNLDFETAYDMANELQDKFDKANVDTDSK